MKLDFSKFEPKLGDWARYLQPVFESEEMYNLFKEFKKSRDITPTSENLFRFLRVCPPRSLSLIIIGMDAYSGRYSNGEYQADGLAFSCSNSPDGKCQPSLVSFYDGIAAEYNEPAFYEPNLEYLAQQGILLGNRALNCKVFKTGYFIGKWDFFWKFFIEEVISKYFPGVPFLLLGKEAEGLKPYIFEMSNPVLTLTHPSHAARTHNLWPTSGTFKQINKLIVGNTGEANRIIWNKKAFDTHLQSCPF